jgi:DNA-binding NarL/FixJ family response regulator
MKSKIRIAIADDHGLMRQGFVSMLDGVDDMEVIASVSSGEEAVNLANESPPDVFLMDIVMQGMNGIEATRWIKEQSPQVKIIIISSEVNKDFIRDGIKSGIDGYLPKDSDRETLLTAIRAVMRGESHFSSEITALVFQDFYLKEKVGKGLPSRKATELTRREEEVLRMIASGKSLKQIADELFISIKTIETHKGHIQDKLGLINTAQLVKFAFEHGLIEIKKPEK